MKIHYAGRPGKGYGWGVCNANLVTELRKLCQVENGPPTETRADGPVFMPLADHDFNPVSCVRGTRNYGYTFFEFPLGPNAAANAARYDRVFCGSTWCMEQAHSQGVYNAEVLIQGVDTSIFRPGPPRKPDGKLRIFSGGKFEFRKGQDIVMAAVDILSERFDCELTAAWFNPWPDTMTSMEQSKHIKPDVLRVLQSCCSTNRRHDFAGYQLLPSISQEALVKEMWDCDVGVFPNRCEGGTNLVLMEWLATGRPAVVSDGTGHLDVINANCVRVEGITDEMGWVHVSPAAVADGVERARKMTGQPGLMDRWSWGRAAKQVFERMASDGG